ncbi:hypothetical protein, partial [Acinetobacter baumannii]|uniref:hypothetical protein n=1 Tax=Acinetobacter baumannii TaxID=470 RepID=UPI001C468C7D
MKGHRNNFADAVQRKYSVAATLLPYITSVSYTHLTPVSDKHLTLPTMSCGDGSVVALALETKRLRVVREDV